MKRIVLCLILLPFFVSVSTSEPRRRGDAQQAKGAKWAHDGKHLVIDGKWRDPLTWEEVERVPRPKRVPRIKTRSLIKRDVEEAGGVAPKGSLGRGGVRTTLPRITPKHPGMRANAKGDQAAAVLNGELWTWTQDKGARRIKQGLKNVRRFEMAPDASAVSYISGFDLFIVRTKDGKTFRVSKDGSDDLFYGELDWVYQEEVYGRGNFKATWWSPDSRHVAYMRIEEKGVNTFHVVDHIPNALNVETLKYPKAGTTNPRATMHIARASDGRSVAVDLSKYKKEDEILIMRVWWTPEGDRCIVNVMNREQTWLDVNFADPDTGEITTVIQEKCDDGWINRPATPRWLSDGTFIWESERTGYKHLYRYDRKGKLVATVSKGEWTVSRIIRLDEKRGFVVFSGTTPDYVIGKNAYRASLDGTSLVKITKGRGNHSLSLNGDGTLALDTVRAMDNPGTQRLLKTSDASVVREIYKRKVPKGAVLPVYKQIKARDGEWLDVVYTLPKDFDAKKKYPVWISTYSGPNAPSVRDRWRKGSRGKWYVGLQVNVRTASGRGMKYTKKCYRQFGVQELKDIEDAVDWLCKNHPWADRSRVGITGWSYGGYMTAYAMTHSKIFKCGIAGAGVYDWELYDTIYTERYMAKPQNNRAGYKISSCVKAAKNLHGQLLIIHGTMDDNVHMQNAIQFIHELQKAGKQNFIFMLYPKSRHGVGSGHLRALREKFMRENL